MYLFDTLWCLFYVNSDCKLWLQQNPYRLIIDAKNIEEVLIYSCLHDVSY